jgi:trans-aconitate 2-methyltransferase
MWDPEVYLRFADERGRPFHEMVARIGADDPRLVVDLGCGPGNLTETLRRRWPAAQVLGLDSSPEMITAARRSAADQAHASGPAGKGSLHYEITDVREYMPAGVDVLVTNAMLQWIPDHQELIARWAGALNPGGWLALQVPANHDGPSHRAVRAVAAGPAWADRLTEATRARPVPGAVDYARLLRAADCAVDAWETTYVHQLPVTAGGGHPVLDWLSGTALRPVKAVLSPDEWRDFGAELSARLEADYPAHQGVVDFPFPRVFVVARRG